MKPEKFNRESTYYTATSKGVRCMICPNFCLLDEGEEGCCHTHIARENKLYTLAYGNPCAIHLDPIEKKPLFHFLPGSSCYSVAIAGCNFTCRNCQNWEISQQGPRKTSNVELFPDQVVTEACKHGCSSVAFTYSEPIAFYEYLLDTVKLTKAVGLKNLFISNGYINKKPLDEITPYLDAANIDLKSFSEDVYIRLNGGHLKPVLKTMKTLKDHGVWLEITNLIIPGWNDDQENIREMCDWLVDQGFSETPLHFSRFFPLYKLSDISMTPLKTMEVARDIATKSGMQYVYTGNLHGTKAENTYCPACHRLLIERQGYRIVENHLKNSHCQYCNHPISGVWS